MTRSVSDVTSSATGEWVPCVRCFRTGRVFRSRCPVCDGEGEWLRRFVPGQPREWKLAPWSHPDEPHLVAEAERYSLDAMRSGDAWSWSLVIASNKRPVTGGVAYTVDAAKRHAEAEADKRLRRNRVTPA